MTRPIDLRCQRVIKCTHMTDSGALYIAICTHRHHLVHWPPQTSSLVVPARDGWHGWDVWPSESSKFTKHTLHLNLQVQVRMFKHLDEDVGAHIPVDHPVSTHVAQAFKNLLQDVFTSADIPLIYLSADPLLIYLRLCWSTRLCQPPLPAPAAGSGICSDCLPVQLPLQWRPCFLLAPPYLILLARALASLNSLVEMGLTFFA